MSESEKIQRFLASLRFQTSQGKSERKKFEKALNEVNSQYRNIRSSAEASIAGRKKSQGVGHKLIMRRSIRESEVPKTKYIPASRFALPMHSVGLVKRDSKNAARIWNLSRMRRTNTVTVDYSDEAKECLPNINVEKLSTVVL